MNWKHKVYIWEIKRTNKVTKLDCWKGASVNQMKVYTENAKYDLLDLNILGMFE